MVGFISHLFGARGRKVVNEIGGNKRAAIARLREVGTPLNGGKLSISDAAMSDSTVSYHMRGLAEYNKIDPNNSDDMRGMFRSLVSDAQKEHASEYRKAA